MDSRSFDIIVIGGGHAGIEAASSSARMSYSVALVTMDKKALGRMSCNPAIGGTAKGHLVRGTWPPELVEEMGRNPESYSMDGRKAELTVLFSDIRGFTTISEGLGPDELTRLMNEYLTAMTDVVRKNRGTLDKYIGDAIMAFWGAPRERYPACPAGGGHCAADAGGVASGQQDLCLKRLA